MDVDSSDSDDIPASCRGLLSGKNTYFSAILLSRWDNILGPQIDYVWSADQKADELPEGVIQYVANHTLNGEIGRNDALEPAIRVTTKLCRFTEKKTIATAFIFKGYSAPSSSRAKHRSAASKSLFSLCLLLPMDRLKSYLPIHDLCDVRMRTYIPKLVHFQEQDASLDTFTNLIEEFVDCVAKITKEPLADVKLEATAFYPTAVVSFSPDFLKRCITSHLQTCGCSIVVGHSRDDVDKMICTLAMFLSPSEKLKSRSAVSEKEFKYESDLFLQGLIVERGHFGYEKIPEVEVIRTQLPSTFINMNTKLVQQTNQLHKHLVMRKDMMEHELGAIGKQLPTTKHEMENLLALNDKKFYSNVFRPTSDKSNLVESFLDEMKFLPALCGVREAYTSQFVRLLQRKALALVKYVEVESPRHGASLDPGSSQELVRKLKSALSLKEEGDWKIVLATAEKLQAGMFRHLLGDPSEHCRRVEQELVNL